MLFKLQKIAIAAAVVVAAGLSYSGFMQFHNSTDSNSSAQAVPKNGGLADAATTIQKYEINPVDVSAGKNTGAESHAYAILIDEHIEKDVIFDEKTKTNFKLKLIKADGDTPAGVYRGTIEIKHYVDFEGDPDFQAPNAIIEGGVYILYTGEIEAVVMTAGDYLKEARDKLGQDDNFKPEPLIPSGSDGDGSSDLPLEPLTLPDDAMPIPEPLVNNYDFRGDGKWLLPLKLKYDATITVPQYSASTGINKDGKQVFPFQILIAGDTVQIIVSKPETVYTFKTSLKKG